MQNDRVFSLGAFVFFFCVCYFEQHLNANKCNNCIFECYFDILITVLVYIFLDVESSKLARRRHSRTSSVGAVNPRLFDKNTLMPNNVHPNKIEHPHAISVPNGTVICDAPSSPQKPKRTVSL